MIRFPLLLIAVLVWISCTKEKSTDTETKTTATQLDSIATQQAAQRRKADQIITISARFKLYWDGRIVDLKESKKFVFKIAECISDDSANSIRFDSLKHEFAIAYSYERSACSHIMIERGEQKMKIDGFDKVDSISFKDGNFFWLQPNRNTLCETKQIGCGEFERLNNGGDGSYGGIERGQAKPKLFKIDTVLEKVYRRAKAVYSSKIDTDSTRVSWTDSLFVVKLGKSTMRFTPFRPGNYGNSDYYLGFLKPLNLYLITRVYGTQEISDLMFVSGKSEKIYYYFEAPSGQMGPPLISPSNNFLLSYSNGFYETAFISVLKIIRNGNEFEFENFGDLFLGETRIEDAIWADDSHIMLHVNRMENKIYKKESVYLRVSLR